jgi:hypothetical protein
MTEKDFFNKYIIALQKSLTFDEESDDFQETNHYDIFDG